MTSNATPLPPGSVIGIVGGGQLGRMLALAAARLGYDVHIYADEPDSPAARVAANATIGAFTDVKRLKAFAEPCAVITYEREHLPADALADGLAGRPVCPNLDALQIAQDRFTEKCFVQENGGETAAFWAVSSANEAAEAMRAHNGPGVLKTRRDGYDGKGQHRIATVEEARAAWTTLGEAPLILEGWAPFVREVSLIAARSATGDWAAYPLTENIHMDGVLVTSHAPAADLANRSEEAAALTRNMMTKLDYVGVMAVEFFETERGLLVNELAPRVHNSGHWTDGGAWCDQFEMHIRAITGLPLGDARPRGAQITMTNLLGDSIKTLPALANGSQTFFQHYGKRGVTSGRKLGHVVEVDAPYKNHKGDGVRQ